MSNKSKSIKSAPRNVRALAARFRQQNPVDTEIKVKEINSELIKEVFQEQFTNAEHNKEKRIVWMEYQHPTEEMKKENPDMEIFIKSTKDLPEKVIAYFQSKADVLEYWDRQSTYPCFKEKTLTIPSSVLAKVAIDAMKDGE